VVAWHGNYVPYKVSLAVIALVLVDDILAASWRFSNWASVFSAV